MNHADPIAQAELDLDAIEARAEAATEGPWKATSGDPARPSMWGVQSTGANEWAITLHWSSREDAEFIAHARADVPALVAAVRTLTAENERLRAAVKFQREGADETGLIAERTEAENERLRGALEARDQAYRPSTYVANGMRPMKLEVDE